MSELNPLIQPLIDLQAVGQIRSIDLALARYIAEEADETDLDVLLAIALTSERNGHGDVCLDLMTQVQSLEWIKHPDFQPLNEWLVSLKALSGNEWWQKLSQSKAFATSSLDSIEPSVLSNTPLVLAGSADRPRLYLRRYWHYEERVKQAIQQRLALVEGLSDSVIAPLLNTLFASSQQHPDWQKIACALAARRSFAVITGGPGTGKTTTVVRLLALLQALAIENNAPVVQIALAAPTGKAAARLNASIAAQIESLPFAKLSQHPELLKRSIPTEVTTLHRLLGPIPNSRRFRHHAHHPLSMDCVVVDEASMVDLEMLAALVEALKPSARLILLGDKDQLASVEAGAVLGDLCQQAWQGGYSDETAAWLKSVTQDTLPREMITHDKTRQLDQAITMLRFSHRFSAQGGIGALAHLVNQGEYQGQKVSDPLLSLKQIFAQQPEQLQIYAVNQSTDAEFAQLVVKGYQGYLRQLVEQRPAHTASSGDFDEWASSILTAHTAFQLLSAVREGVWGVHSLNSWITQLLTRANLISNTQALWYEGRPILVTQNDYNLRLMNGDIGITLKRPVVDADGEIREALRVVFPTPEGGIRWVMPSRLQAIETVYAMTVHKSQGSEFTHTALVLPDQPSAVLTQELIYTAITRSRETFSLVYSKESVLRQALTTRVKRLSGLTFS